MPDNNYVHLGYKNRRDYLESLAENNGYPLNAVLELADALGSNEDFDGLVSNLEDFDASGAFDSYH